MKLRDIAHSRAGDKGNISNLSLVVLDPADYPLIEREVTAERVREHFGATVRGEVVRYELPLVGALNFVMQGALSGGVTRSLAVDIHGKSFSSKLLDMEI